MLKPNVRAHAGRDGQGRIILDMTSIEKPACTLRLVFESPDEADKLFADLGDLLLDEAANRRAYPEMAGPEDHDTVEFDQWLRNAMGGPR